MMAGRVSPSSHKSHSSTICINPWPLLWPDVLSQSSLIFGMSGLGAGPGFFHGIRDKRFLTSDHQELTPGLRVQVWPVPLKPGAVPSGLFSAGPKSNVGLWVADFLDEDRLMIHRTLFFR